MWTSAQLKANAKLALKTRYGLAIIISLIAGFLAGGTPGMSTSYFTGSFNTNNNDVNQAKDFVAQSGNLAGFLLSAISVLVVFAALAGIAYGIFVAMPIKVGQNRFYLQNRMGQGEIGTLFSVFKPGYLNVVKAVLLKNVYVFLWSLLFIIPGIIKSYEYYVVEYILAENPNMDAVRALDLSRQMTQNQKLDIFLVELSFIGWSILSMCTCGIGFIFLTPYMQATYAELYTALREKAIAEGAVTLEELTGVVAL